MNDFVIEKIQKLQKLPPGYSESFFIKIMNPPKRTLQLNIVKIGNESH
jgi:hypothetical protein